MEFEVSEGFKWVVTTIIGFLGLVITGLGLKKIAEIITLYFTRKKEDQRALHQSNTGRAIDFDQFAFQKYAERLEKVETKLEKVEKELTSQMVTNEGLKKENEHLKETNERQQGEIVELRSRETILTQQVNSLTNIIVGLQKEIDSLKRGDNGH